MVNQRKKGQRFELEIVQLLKEYGLDMEAKRNLEFQEGSVDIATSLPFAIQCKNTKSWAPNPTQSYKQALDGSKKLKHETVPVVFHRITNKGEYAIINLYHFFDLLKALMHFQEQVSRLQRQLLDVTTPQSPMSLEEKN